LSVVCTVAERSYNLSKETEPKTGSSRWIYVFRNPMEKHPWHPQSIRYCLQHTFGW